MSRWRLYAGIGIVAAVGVVACGSQLDSAFSSPGTDRPTADAGSGGGKNDSPVGAAAPGIAPLEKGIILVHAANSSAFRVCFENAQAQALLPQPDSKIMPASNIVGVEVGTAVRIDPISGPPGRIYVFSAKDLQPFYGPDKQNYTCKDLIKDQTKTRTVLGPITDDFSNGVHVLALTGCVAGTGSVANCGSDYTDQAGNIGLFNETVLGYERTGGQGVLPLQVLHLSQPLEGARAGRTIAVSFRDGTGASPTETNIASDPPLRGQAQPAGFPAQLPFDGTDAGNYASYSVRIAFEQSDGGSTTVLDQSLASIQALSSPRDLPPTYYAQASNFVLMMLGDPALVQPDGGGDAFEQLHLLAIPVLEPKPDGGADGGDGG